jgi:hypothetical protein
MMRRFEDSESYELGFAGHYKQIKGRSQLVFADSDLQAIGSFVRT